MALIECTECGHKVSDKAETCPSCGYRVSDIKKDMSNFVFCKINGENVNVTKIREHLLSLSESELKDYLVIFSSDADEETNIAVEEEFEAAGKESIYNRADEWYENIVTKIINLGYPDLSMFLVEFITNNMEPIEFNGKPKPNIKPTSVPIPRCPTCSSTNIRKLGFFETGIYCPKTFRCNNCGYEW